MAKKKQPTLAIATVGEKTERKRLGRPPADPPPSNVADDTFREFCAKALREKSALDAIKTKHSEQNGRYRSVLKDAEKAGVPSKALTTWLANKDVDADILLAEQRAYLRVARLMGMPIGTQLSFEDAPASDAASTDRGVMQERAYQAGLTAGKAAETFDAERYPNDPDCQTRYEQGWHDGQDEHVQALRGNGKAESDGAEARA